MLSWSRSAIALNWLPRVVISLLDVTDAWIATRALRSPPARSRDASVRRTSGRVNWRAMTAATTTASARATIATTASRVAIVRTVSARTVYGCERVTRRAYGNGVATA